MWNRRSMRVERGAEIEGKLNERKRAKNKQRERKRERQREMERR